MKIEEDIIITGIIIATTIIIKIEFMLTDELFQLICHNFKVTIYEIGTNKQ